MMTLRERILAVYRGACPEVVPFMLDLSHWFYHLLEAIEAVNANLLELVDLCCTSPAEVVIFTDNFSGGVSPD